MKLRHGERIADYNKTAEVVKDMLTDLFPAIQKKSRFLYRGTAENLLLHPEQQLPVIVASDELTSFIADNPNLGQPRLDVPDIDKAITELAIVVGILGVHLAMDTPQFGARTGLPSLKVDGIKMTPPQFVSEVWSQDYGTRFTEAVRLGLTGGAEAMN